MQVAHTSRQFMEEIPKLKREEEIFQLFFFSFSSEEKKKAAAAAADWCDLNHIRMRISNSFSHSPICSLEIPSIYFFFGSHRYGLCLFIFSKATVAIWAEYTQLMYIISATIASLFYQPLHAHAQTQREKEEVPISRPSHISTDVGLPPPSG